MLLRCNLESTGRTGIDWEADLSVKHLTNKDFLQVLGRLGTPVNFVPGDPNGTRTRVFAVKGRRPRPLDDGAD